MQTKTSYDYLIIGAGPAGLQLGYFLEQAGRDYLILEAGDSPGSFFKQFPRHRKLISINKVYTGYNDPETNLRWDWNSLLSDDQESLFKHYSKHYFPSSDALVRYLGDFAARHELNVQYNTRVVTVSKADLFCVEDAQGKLYQSKCLIMATGVSQPYVPSIPGIELAEPYTTVSVCPEEFTNQKVLIIGKGNSAFETADNLIDTTALLHVASPHPLQLAWKSHFVGHLRAVNNNLLDTYQLKSQNAVLDATIQKITQRDGQYIVTVVYAHADGETEELSYDRVIACTGFRFDSTIFAENCRPELAINNRFPAQSSAWESINVPDLYFAGTITQARDFKKTTSGFIHGFRYNVRALYRLFEQKYHGNAWPKRAVCATVEALLQTIVERVNCTSALWQQFGFLGDLIVAPSQQAQPNATAWYYEELPVDYIHESDLGRYDNYYILTLEFGKIVGDPFSIERHPDPSQAAHSTFLHPVIRHFSGAVLLTEHHMLENLYGEWRDENAHIQPLRNFLAQNLANISRYRISKHSDDYKSRSLIACD